MSLVATLCRYMGGTVRGMVRSDTTADGKFM